MRSAIWARAIAAPLLLGSAKRNWKNFHMNLGVIAFCLLGNGGVSIVEDLEEGLDGKE